MGYYDEEDNEPEGFEMILGILWFIAISISIWYALLYVKG